MSIVPLTKDNIGYVAEYYKNLIFELLSKDQIFSKFVEIPEFSQPLTQGIYNFFQNAPLNNSMIDLSKMSDLNENIENIDTQSSYENDEFQSQDNLEDDLSSENIIMSMNKLWGNKVKIAAGINDYKKIIQAMLPALKGKLGTTLGRLPYIGKYLGVVAPFIDTIVDFLIDLITKIIDSIENAVLEKFDPEFWKELVLSYNAYDAINEARRSEMYSVEAYNHMLENKEARGYGGQLHSQGAYEVFGPKFKEQFSQQVVQNPELVNSRYKDDPNVGPRVKQNFEQIIARNNKRFVKVAQQEMSEASQSQLKELQSVVPTWDIRNVLKDVHTIYQSPDIPQEDKEQAVDATISRYMRAVQPLYQFLKENNYPTPDTAQ